MSGRRALAWLLCGKLAVSALVWAGGFRAVSDDDYARVVLMQQWAEAPKLDPTGSSWLPFPFWLGGSAMLLGGSTLWMARAVALLSGCAATVLLYRAACTLVGRRDALAGALLAAWLPWSAILGVATVPELLTAALGIFALSTVALPAGSAHESAPRHRASSPHHTSSPLWGGAALLLACLSRYEAWVIALCFVALLLRQAHSPDNHSNTPDSQTTDRPSNTRKPHTSPSRWLAAALALAGPALWLLHNAIAHGSALRFAERVSAYRRALHGAPPAWHAWLDHLLLLLRQEPELWLAALLAAAAYRLTGKRWPQSLPRMALAAAVLLVALSWAAGRGGTATHHAGRSLLLIWLLAALYTGAAIRALLRSPLRVPIAAGIALLIVLGMTILRPWYGRFEHFSRREPLAHFGAAAAIPLQHASTETLATPPPAAIPTTSAATTAPATTPPGPTAAATPPRVLLDASDYGYFAIQAGSGQPSLWHLDRTLDPRTQQPQSSFRSCTALRDTRTRLPPSPPLTHVATHRPEATTWLGAPLVEHAGWALYRLPATLDCTAPQHTRP